MNSGQKLLMLVLFAIAAWLRVLFGAPPPSGKALTADLISMPAPLAGWNIVKEEPITSDPSCPGKSAVYQAPDGSTLTIQIRIAWAERRNLPVPFYPDDCTFLGKGWNFSVRGAEDSIGPGIRGHRIEVQKDKVHLALLSAYSCDGKVAGTWQDFKMELIWQRVRRERKLWVKSLVVCKSDGEARKGAASMLLAAAKGAVSIAK